MGKGGALSNGALFASLTKGVGALPTWGARMVLSLVIVVNFSFFSSLVTFSCI